MYFLSECVYIFHLCSHWSSVSFGNFRNRRSLRKPLVRMDLWLCKLHQNKLLEHRWAYFIQSSVLESRENNSFLLHHFHISNHLQCVAFSMKTMGLISEWICSWCNIYGRGNEKYRGNGPNADGFTSDIFGFVCRLDITAETDCNCNNTRGLLSDILNIFQHSSKLSFPLIWAIDVLVSLNDLLVCKIKFKAHRNFFQFHFTHIKNWTNLLINCQWMKPTTVQNGVIQLSGLHILAFAHI